MSRRVIKTLQVGRAIAAVAVVLHHAEQAAFGFLSRSEAWPHVFIYGYLGVDFFFVLSGFIIYYATHINGSPPQIGTYVRQRFGRIYLPYLPIGIGIALLYTAFPSASASDREWGWFSTLTLLPSSDNTALSVAWTLQHEIVFYAIFGLGLYVQRLRAVMTAWASAILLTNIAYSGDVPKALQPILAIINFEFFFGMFAAWLVLTERRMSGVVLVVVGGCAVSIWLLLGASRSHSIVVAAAFTAMMLLVVQLETARRIEANRHLVFTGDASYAIYLIHPPVIAVVVRLLGDFSTQLHHIVSIVLLVLSSLVAGFAYHLLFERPALGAYRRLGHGRLMTKGGRRMQDGVPEP